MREKWMETADRLLNRAAISTCSFTTAKEAAATLSENGFQERYLGEEKWDVKPGDRIFIRENGSTVFAFAIGEEFEVQQAAEPEQMLRLAAAHTDHPCLYIKTKPEICAHGYGKLNVEVYGGAILNTWLDRPLSVAGRVVLKSENPFEPEVRIIDMKRPVMTVPNLAVHLNREINKGIELNKQTELEPIALLSLEEEKAGKEFFLEALAKELRVSVTEILDFELYLYNCEVGDCLGLNEDLISAPRLDNITSVEACLHGICSVSSPGGDGSRRKGINGIVLYDNEEIGSRTKQGADSVLLQMILEKLYGALGLEREKALTAMLGAFVMSLDVAHGFHPNYPAKLDPTNECPLGGGVVIKRSSAQNYVTDSEAIGTVIMLLENAQIPYRRFASRSDVPQGGTLGSIASKYLPVKMVDMGVPLLAMHSARELMAVRDQVALENFIKEFFIV